MRLSCTCLLGVLLFAVTTAGDELRLKDGSRIVGTIVGFEENSFKVQTSYGFAVVRKDQVVTIVVAGAEKAAGAEKKAPEKKPPEPPPPNSVARAEPQGKTGPMATEPATPPPASAPSRPPEKNPPVTSAKSLASAAPAKASEKNSAPAAPAVARKQQMPPPPAPAPAKPAPPPVPEQIREEVSGNSYANLTFGFRMYKPPDWEVIEGARKLLPSTITAMGTSDETTYLLIGQEPLSGPAEPHIAATEGRLREVLDNFRPLGEKQIAVAGAPAHQQRFRGMANDRDWSGVVVFITHGDRLFTIFGMTAADSDLVQIQENVINRAITSLEFTKQ